MTTPAHLLAGRHIGLVEAVDHLLDKGVVVTGDAMVSLAGIDLVYLRLHLMLSSVERLKGIETSVSSALPLDQAQAGSLSHSATGGKSIWQSPSKSDVPTGHSAAPESMLPPTDPSGETDNTPGEARELAKLVLTLVDMLRRVLQRQALGRMEGGNLSDEETERMGLALMDLETKMTSLCSAFGLDPEDLEIDLGPLGKIL